MGGVYKQEGRQDGGDYTEQQTYWCVEESAFVNGTKYPGHILSQKNCYELWSVD